MSPVFILSRLCLKRRFQFFGISVPPLVRYLTTFLTASSSITLRSPTRSALSAGTFTVMSLCRILIVRYSRFSPSTSRRSRFTTVPAPWWGYTTLSPTLYKLTPSPVAHKTVSLTKAPATWMRPARRHQSIRIGLKARVLQGFWSLLMKKPCSDGLLGKRLQRVAQRRGFEGSSLGSGGRDNH